LYEYLKSKFTAAQHCRSLPSIVQFSIKNHKKYMDSDFQKAFFRGLFRFQTLPTAGVSA
jgi:hypothetical protein